MSERSWESMALGRSDACERLQPCVEALGASQQRGATECTPARGRTLRVLVVDDNRDAADTLSMLVGAWGYDVRLAYAGAAALHMMPPYRPHVLLLDVGMPDVTGCDVAQQLRRDDRFKDTFLVAITGYADQSHQRLCEQAGFDRYLIKPVDLGALERLLLVQQREAGIMPRARGVWDCFSRLQLYDTGGSGGTTAPFAGR